MLVHRIMSLKNTICPGVSSVVPCTEVGVGVGVEGAFSSFDSNMAYAERGF